MRVITTQGLFWRPIYCGRNRLSALRGYGVRGLPYGTDQVPILNFRSINDSGEVTVDRITSLVGRNESGKSNLLLGLATLNPSGGRKPLNKIKDFPRGRRLEECTDETPVVTSRWKLSAAETTAIGKTLGGYSGAITEVEIRRRYEPTPKVDLAVTRPSISQGEVESIMRRLGPVLMPRIAALDDPHKSNSDAAWKGLEATAKKAACRRRGQPRLQQP